MTALIFGINGQDGFYLKHLLQGLNYDIVGVSRSGDFILGDVSDFKFVQEIIKKTKPEFIFHFAANSTVRHDALFENYSAIELGTINILEACYKHSRDSKIFLSGSAVQFTNIGHPIDEQTSFSALSPYAVSRIASVYAGRYYRNLSLKVYVGYFFNHDSPLRTDRHINKMVVSVIQRIAQGSNEILEIGDLNTRKEFNYAEDVVKAVWILVNQEKYFEAVIGSGRAYSIKDWVETCFRIIGKDWNDYVRVKKEFISDYQILISNPERIYSLGWQPKVDFNNLAELMMSKE